MTNLDKPVKRRTVIFTDHRNKSRLRDSVVVSLYPEGDIGFRRLRCRKEIRLSLSAVMILAEKKDAQERAKDKQSTQVSRARRRVAL